MTTKRFLPGALLLVLTAGPATAQYGSNYSTSSSQYSDLIPSVAPYEQEPAQSLDAAMPPGRPSAAMTTPLDRVASPVRMASNFDPAPFATLTGQPPVPPQATLGIPKGSYPNPYEEDVPGCCGPVGGFGRIGEEVYTQTGVSIPFGRGDFVHRLEVGWMVGAGGRSLFFNPEHDAAWVAELGWNFQYNRGNQNSPTELNVRQPNTTNSTTGVVTAVPDVLTNVLVRDVISNNFTFALGRDWWIYGPGATGKEQSWNLRLGALVGGSYGTAHIDEEPYYNQTGYFRRQAVTHGIFLDFHAEWEMPLGAVILFSGIHLQYGYDWTNIAPPFPSDIQTANILVSAGFRF